MSYTLEGSIKVENGKTFIINQRMREIVGNYDLDRCEGVTFEEISEKMVSGVDYAEIVYDEITDTSRWSVNHECIFKLEGKYFRTHYSEGATEMQDEAPFEYDGDWIEVTEVVPKEVTVIKYVAKGSN